MYFVNLRVDDVELLNPQHSRHRLWLDGPQVGVVYGELVAVEESPEGVGDHVEQVEEVQLEVFHCLQAVEGVLTNDGGRLDLCYEITLPAPAGRQQRRPASTIN